jgi:hypothetical protein
MNTPGAWCPHAEGDDRGKHWTIDVRFDEYQGQTRARAELHRPGRTSTGVGFSRVGNRNPRLVPIDDELAAARALADLASRLTAAGAHDMDSVTGTP